MAARGTTQVGYENRNKQIVLRKTDLPGNDHNQLVYVLRCIPAGMNMERMAPTFFSAVVLRMTLVRQVCDVSDETREWSGEMQEDARLTLFDALPSKRDLRAKIDRLSLSADAKAVLNDILEVVIDVGGRVISVGRQVLTFVLDMMRR